MRSPEAAIAAPSIMERTERRTHRDTEWDSSRYSPISVNRIENLSKINNIPMEESGYFIHSVWIQNIKI